MMDGQGSGGRFYILAYHRLGEKTSLDGVTIAHQEFIEHMRYLREHCVLMRLGEAVEAGLQRRRLPRRTVAVTFDDGYTDTFTLAFPILRRLGIPATVFITTGAVDRIIWPDGPFLSWPMVKTMHRAGIEIGSHAVTHPNLRQCALEQVRQELAESRRRLEEELAVPVTLLAYPYGAPGSFNRAIQRCARETGYRAACTVIPGVNGPETDRYALRRVVLRKNAMWDFARELAELATTRGGRDRQTAIHGFTDRAKALWRRRYRGLDGRVRREGQPDRWGWEEFRRRLIRA